MLVILNKKTDLASRVEVSFLYNALDYFFGGLILSGSPVKGSPVDIIVESIGVVIISWFKVGFVIRESILDPSLTSSTVQEKVLNESAITAKAKILFFIMIWVSLFSITKKPPFVGCSLRLTRKILLDLE